MYVPNTKFSQTGLLPEALVAGLLVERDHQYRGFIATDLFSPWFPRIIGWEKSGTVGNSTAMSREAAKLCADKLWTEEILRAEGLPVLNSKEFQLGDFEDFFSRNHEQLSWPVIVKPRRGHQGKGVYTSIRDEQTLVKTVSVLLAQYGANKRFIIQRQVSGTEYRFFSSPAATHAAYLRIPPNVIGDGTSSIQELVNRKNALRGLNPHLRSPSRRVRLDETEVNTLLEQSLSITSVPAEGRQVWLSNIGNTHAGADTVAVTDEVHPSLMELAARAVAAIPGLDFGGVDIFLEKGHQFSADDQNVTVLEINTNIGLGGHLYPMVGEPKNVCEVIVRETAEAAGIPVMDRPDDLTIIGEVEHPRMPARQALDEVQDLGLLSAIAVKKENGFGFALSGPVDSMTHAIKIVSQQWGGVLRAVRDDNFAVPNGVSVRDDINIPALPPSPLPRVFRPVRAKSTFSVGARFALSRLFWFAFRRKRMVNSL